MAQNVGPILEMVTEKYLLRSEAEWAGPPGRPIGMLDEILAALRAGDIRGDRRRDHPQLRRAAPDDHPLGQQPLHRDADRRKRAPAFGADFWGFWMLGGMSGGGMGFIFAPERKAAGAGAPPGHHDARPSGELEHALPFAMEPVVYDFAINPHGTFADLLAADDGAAAAGYYALIVPAMLRLDPRTLSPTRRAELDRFATACRTRPELSGMVQTLFDRLLPRTCGASGASSTSPRCWRPMASTACSTSRSAPTCAAGGSAWPRTACRSAARSTTSRPTMSPTRRASCRANTVDLGLQALADGAVAVVTLAGGAGSRWTQGAGVVKALHPFAGWAASTAPSSKSTWPRAAASASFAATRSRTSSPPAT